MKPSRFILAGILVVVGCNRNTPTPTGEGVSLTEARRGFTTKATPRGGGQVPVDEPPPNLFRLVRYDAPVGKLAAYLTPDPKDGKKHPAIIWITGGDCNSIGKGSWNAGPSSNDQSASPFRRSGIIRVAAQ